MSAGRSRCVVVTGTDTGVGKTRVATSLAHRLRRSGHRVVAVKPVESGCDQQPSAEEDGVQLAQAAGQRQPLAALCRLPDPVAPPVAAERCGRSIDLPALVQQTRTHGQDADLLLVEGAGGLLSPLSWQYNTLDLACQLEASVILVAGNVLGVLNHILLTLGVLETAGIVVHGVVLSQQRVDSASDSNAQSLARLRPQLPIVVLPEVHSAEAGAEHLARVADWVLGEP